MAGKMSPIHYSPAIFPLKKGISYVTGVYADPNFEIEDIYVYGTSVFRNDIPSDYKKLEEEVEAGTLYRLPINRFLQDPSEYLSHRGLDISFDIGVINGTVQLVLCPIIENKNEKTTGHFDYWKITCAE